MINTVVRSREIYVWQQFFERQFVFWESIKFFFSVLSSIKISKNSQQDRTNSRAWWIMILSVTLIVTERQRVGVLVMKQEAVRLGWIKKCQGIYISFFELYISQLFFKHIFLLHKLF